jgi:hypothetical protein
LTISWLNLIFLGRCAFGVKGKEMLKAFPKRRFLFPTSLLFSTTHRTFAKPSKEDIQKYDDEIKERFPELKTAEQKINTILNSENKHVFKEVAIETIKTPPFVLFVLLVVLVVQSLFKRRTIKKYKEELHIKNVQVSGYEQQIINLNQQIEELQKE